MPLSGGKGEACLCQTSATPRQLNCTPPCRGLRPRISTATWVTGFLFGVTSGGMPPSCSISSAPTMPYSGTMGICFRSSISSTSIAIPRRLRAAYLLNRREDRCPLIVRQRWRGEALWWRHYRLEGRDAAPLSRFGHSCASVALLNPNCAAMALTRNAWLTLSLLEKM